MRNQLIHIWILALCSFINDLHVLQSYIADPSWAFINNLFLTNFLASGRLFLDKNVLIEKNTWVLLPWSWTVVTMAPEMHENSCFSLLLIFHESNHVERRADALQLFNTWLLLMLSHLKQLLCAENYSQVWCYMELFGLFGITWSIWMVIPGFIIASQDGYCFSNGGNEACIFLSKLRITVDICICS